MKPAKYLYMGVAEYWRFDPTGCEFLQPALQGDRRVGNTWQPITVGADDDGRLSGHSETLDLTLYADAHRLRLRDPHTGEWLRDHDEETARADREAAARAAAEARADQEAAARAAAEAELAALRKRLDPQH